MPEINIVEHLKKGGKVRTRDPKRFELVTIFATDMVSDLGPIVARVRTLPANGGAAQERVYQFYANGHLYKLGEVGLDLLPVPTVEELITEADKARNAYATLRAEHVTAAEEFDALWNPKLNAACEKYKNALNAVTQAERKERNVA